MSASSRRRTRKKRKVYKGAANTYRALPYFTLDKAIEAELDKPPETLKKLPRPVKVRLAVKLRLAGATYEQIAEKLGYSRANIVENAVHEVIARSYKLDDPDEVAQIVKSDMMRLDAMQLVYWERAVRYGDEKAGKLVLDIMAERRKLLGIEGKDASGGISIHLEGDNPKALVIGGDENDFISQLRELRGEDPQQALASPNGHKQESGQEDVIDAEIVDDEEEIE